MARIADPETPVLQEPPPETVTVRVIEDGDARISTGQNEFGRGDLHYELDETFECPKPLAERYRKLHWVMIERPVQRRETAKP